MTHLVTVLRIFGPSLMSLLSPAQTAKSYAVGSCEEVAVYKVVLKKKKRSVYKPVRTFAFVGFISSTLLHLKTPFSSSCSSILSYSMNATFSTHF